MSSRESLARHYPHPIEIITSRTFQENSLKEILLSLRKGSRDKSSGPREVEESLLLHPGAKKCTNFNLRGPHSQNILILNDFLDEIPTELLNAILGKNLLVGPNIDLTLERNIRVMERLPHAGFLTPSNWPVKMISDYSGIKQTKIYTWFAGVDSSKWHSPKNKQIEREVLLYVKDFSAEGEAQKCRDYFTAKDMKFTQINYGHYTNQIFQNQLAKTSHMVVVGTTESQGIAQFQAWSMNVPTLISRREFFKCENRLYSASSSPYLSGQTGVFSKNSSIEPDDLTSFLSEDKNHTPREWVLKNATIEIAFQNLLNIFRLHSIKHEMKSQ
jgi:hypothetical protein